MHEGDVDLQENMEKKEEEEEGKRSYLVSRIKPVPNGRFQQRRTQYPTFVTAF